MWSDEHEAAIIAIDQPPLTEDMKLMPVQQLSRPGPSTCQDSVHRLRLTQQQMKGRIAG